MSNREYEAGKTRHDIPGADELCERLGIGPYELTRIIAIRVEQLVANSLPYDGRVVYAESLLEFAEGMKPQTIAMLELNEGLLQITRSDGEILVSPRIPENNDEPSDSTLSA